MYSLEFIKQHSRPIDESLRKIDWHLKQVALHCQIGIGPIEGTGRLTNDQRAIVLGFINEAEKPQNLTPIESMNDPLIYLTGKALPALIQVDEESQILSFTDIARHSVAIAKEALNEIEKNQVEEKQPAKSSRSGQNGENNGWLWLVMPFDFAFDRPEPNSPWYAELTSLTNGARYENADCQSKNNALSLVSQFCAFHLNGKFDPDKPDYRFELISESLINYPA